MKLLIIGHGRHGKDTVAELFNEYKGLKFKSSSLAAAEIFLYDDLKSEYGYKSFEECYEDRHTVYDNCDMRELWHNKISEYNTPTKSKLAEDIMSYNDIYVGMRCDKELEACKDIGLFDLVIGVFDPRKPLEDKKSFKIDVFKQSDFIIMNNSNLDTLRKRVELFSKML